MNIIKSPQDNIKAFLYNDINIDIYNDFDGSGYEGKLDTLEFFNLLYHELNFLIENIEDYLTIVEHFEKYDYRLKWLEVEINEPLLLNNHFLFESLSKLLNLHYPIENRENIILKTCEYVENIYNDINYVFLREHIGENEEVMIESSKIYNVINWQGTQLEFTELIKALIESHKLNPNLTQTEIFRRLKQFFNVEEYNENDKLKDIRKRTNTTTPLLNILENSLNNWIKRKD